jgi:hypothetical protein
MGKIDFQPDVPITGDILKDRQNMPAGNTAKIDFKPIDFQPDAEQPMVNGTSGGTPGKTGEGLDYFFPAWFTGRKYGQDEYGVEKMNIYGDVLNRPAAAVRSFIQGKGWLNGALRPSEVPTFQEIYEKKVPFKARMALGLLGPLGGQAGTTVDIATDPVAVATMGLPFTKAGKGIDTIITGTGKQFVGKAGEIAQGMVKSPTVKIAEKGISNIKSSLSVPWRATQQGIEYLKKSSADYINQKVVPDAYEAYQNSIKNWTPQIQKFAVEKLGIPPTAVDTIKKKGVDYVNKVRVFYDDTTDLISQKIIGGFEDKWKVADDAYGSAMNNVGSGKAININRSINEAGARLKRLGLITERGNLTELGKSEISRDSVYGKMLDFYQSADAISGVEKLQGKSLTQGQMIKAMKADRETLVNKDQYTFLRDKLNSLYKNKPSDVDVSRVVNQFYADGEASGLKGLQQARSLQRQAFQAEEKYLNKQGGLKALGKERGLDKFHKMTQDEIRQLREVENYTGVKFVDDLDALTAGRELDKLTAFDINKFSADLNKAVDPKWTEWVKKEYRELLGEPATKKIFDEVVKHRRGIKIKQLGGIGVGVGVAEEVTRRGLRALGK